MALLSPWYSPFQFQHLGISGLKFFGCFGSKLNILARRSQGILMDLDALDHFAITVVSLKESFGWYNKVFGFEIFHQWTTTWMVRRGDMRIGLFERPSGTPVEDLNNKIAFQHIAFHVSADAFIQSQIELAALKVPIETLEDTGVAYSLFIRDPDGHLVELTTYYSVPGATAPAASYA